MKEIKAPNKIRDNGRAIFLAGSIEMDKAEKWQEKIIKMLTDTNWVILNPRRDDWDSSWEEKISNYKFYEQVNWELKGIEMAKKIVVYFDKNSTSPITLLELGLIAGRSPQKAIIVCPDGFFKKGNVDIVCNRYNIKQVKTLEEVAEILKNCNPAIYKNLSFGNNN